MLEGGHHEGGSDLCGEQCSGTALSEGQHARQTGIHLVEQISDLHYIRGEGSSLVHVPVAHVHDGVLENSSFGLWEPPMGRPKIVS